jgi:hypothetical protein
MRRFVVCVLAICLACGGLQAEEFHLKPDGTDSTDRDGKSPANAWKSLAYACERIPAGTHTLKLAPGTYAEERTAKPKAGLTISGAGVTGNQASRVVASKTWLLGPVVAPPKPPAEFLISAVRVKDVNIRGIAFASDPSHRISGAMNINHCENIIVADCTIEDFRWAGLYVTHTSKLELAHCQFRNAATEKDKYHTGSIRSQWLKDSSIHDCSIVHTEGKEYGYKAGGHQNVKFYNNKIEILGEFAFESAHENEFGLDIYNNEFNGCISVPKSGQGANPNERGFTFSVWIHHNVLTDSYTVEGPRNHLRLSHNHIRITRPNGRVYSQHGGDNKGPVWIHHNVVENLDRAFVWKNRGRAENITVTNNLVFCAETPRAGAIIDASHSDKEPIAGWTVIDNIFVAPKAQPRRAVTERALPQMQYINNVCVDCTAVPAGNFTMDPPDFLGTDDKPHPFYTPKPAGFLATKAKSVPMEGFPKPTAIGPYEVAEKKIQYGIVPKK